MKKVLYFASFLLCMGFMASCEKDDIENTATVKMAGQWYVQIDGVDEDGEVIPGYEDYFGTGRVLLLTYNTAGNNPDEMFIDDLGAFDVATFYDYDAYPSYSFKSKVEINQKDLTFSTENAENLADANKFESDLYPVTIKGGKILKNAGHQNNGSVADSIVFYISYDGDPWYPDDGYAMYRVSGIRYSGLVEND